MITSKLPGGSQLSVPVSLRLVPHTATPGRMQDRAAAHEDANWQDERIRRVPVSASSTLLLALSEIHCLATLPWLQELRSMGLYMDGTEPMQVCAIEEECRMDILEPA